MEIGTVAEDGTISISDATAAEITKFDTGTTATARISGEAAAGGDQELVRYIPLRDQTPWHWLLVPALAGLFLAWMRRNHRLAWRRSAADEHERLRPSWLSPRFATRLPIGLALGALAGLVPAWIGWSGMYFDLGFAGLLSTAIVPILVVLVRVRRSPDEPTRLEPPPL